MLDSFGGMSANPAFEPSEFPLSYGLVTLAIFLVGFGLVEAASRPVTKPPEHGCYRWT